MVSLAVKRSAVIAWRSRILDAASADLEHHRARVPRLLTWYAVDSLADAVPISSAKWRLVPSQRLVALTLLLGLITWVATAPVAVGVALNVVFLAFCFAVLFSRIMLLVLSVRAPLIRHIKSGASLSDDALPIITILCPMYDEVEGLPGLVRALMMLDYPMDKLDIKLLLEEDDAATVAKAYEIATAPCFDIVIVPASQPRTKPKACNYALPSARGSLLVIYDAEDRPEVDQLRKVAAAFSRSPENVVCLQARLNYYNRHKNVLTRLFAIEYALLFDLVLPGLARLGAPLPLGGTSNFFRTDVLIAVGGWDPYNVTEDADLGLRLARRGYRSGVIDSTTYEEATSEIEIWIKQRSRWIKGYIQTWFVHTRHRTSQGERALGWRYTLTVQLIVGGVAVAALFNPFFWALYALWITGSAGWIDLLFPGPLEGLAKIALLAGNLFHVWLFMLAPMARGWHDLVPYALLAPLYWVLQSVAGYKALWQFFVKPFHWEKTAHGKGICASRLFGDQRKERFSEVGAK